MNNSEIARNIFSVRERIRESAEKAGRNPDEITLVAVSKMVSKAEMIDAYENAGQVDFGENRVQSLIEKYVPEFNWHMIGHLQKNKVKYIVDKVKLIHSVDSIDLMDEIERQAKKASRQVPFLLQVNVSGEESKFGVKISEVEGIVMKMSQYRNISLEGLMTIAPNVTNSEKTRVFFNKLYNIYIDTKKERTHNVSMKYLSMGMSNDYEVAIAEGANLVRIGSSIFTKAEKA